MNVSDVPRLVAAPREHYVRQNEARIRDLALPAKTADPIVATHLAAVLMAEDIEDRHRAAVESHRTARRETLARDHERYVAMAVQLRLHHLSQLASILI